jgi:hypothetical protein
MRNEWGDFSEKEKRREIDLAKFPPAPHASKHTTVSAEDIPLSSAALPTLPPFECCRKTGSQRRK